MCQKTSMAESPEELALLFLKDEHLSNSEEFCAVTALLREGNFIELFRHPWFSVYKCKSHEELPGIIKRLTANPENKLKLLTTAVCFLNHFIQQNFIGPIDKICATDQLFPPLKHFDYLNVDGEDAYHLVRSPGALLVTRLVIVDNANSLDYPTLNIWRQRYALVHQHLLPEKVPSLQEIVENANLTDASRTSTNVERLDVWACRWLETALANIEYCNVAVAERCLVELSEKLGISAELSGALGTRTHFQRTSLPQLMLKIDRSKPQNNSFDSNNRQDIPTDVSLQDDTVRNRIKFDKEQDNASLTCIEQLFVLGISMLRKRLNAPEELLDEEVMAYLDHLLTEPQSWTVQYVALFHRCVIECSKSRKVERAISQYETLRASLHKSQPRFGDRSQWFFASRVPTTWKLEQNLANGFVSLGLTKSALDIFLELEMWEEVVGCYLQIQRNDRAEAIVRDLLAVEKTPQNYCLLGDVTNDPENYRLAWELSNQSNARAKRSWGNYHFQRKEYDQAIPHLRESLKLNRLHHRAWQQLAFACMTEGLFEESVSAYKRVVNIDSDNFEAWNNMAKAYISLNEKEKAWRVLQESLKCNYEDWRIWENYLLVSMDVGSFNEVVKSWHRLIDIKHKHVDAKVASLLVEVVRSDIKDFDGNAASTTSIQKKLFELFGRATTTITNDGDMWNAYGDLYSVTKPSDDSKWSDHVQKMLQCYQKAIRSKTQKNFWERDHSTATGALDVCDKVWKSLNQSGDKLSADEKFRLEASLQMTIKNVLTMAKRGVEYHSEELRPAFLGQLETLETSVKK